MTFSVVIPTRNRRDLLERTLQSVWMQSRPADEVLVVDDASTDDTVAWLDSQGGRLRVLQSGGAGPGAARNTGARAATGDYVAFLDSDDLWFPWTLATLAAAIDLHQQPSYIGSSFRQFADEAELKSESAAVAEVQSFANYFSTWPRQLVIGAGMIVVRRDVFLQCGGFCEEPVNLEDHDLSLKLGLAPGFLHIMRPVTMAWRMHPGGVTRDLGKSARGCELLLSTERRDGYPGGARWASVRRNIITTHTRAFTLEALRAGRTAEAWRVYRATFAWHVALGRLRYLTAFPMMAAARSLQSPAA
jgi:hypothetical protein